MLGHYVSEVTLLHPGLVAFIMNMIYERFLSQLKEGKEVLTFEKIYAYLSSYRFNEFIRVRGLSLIMKLLYTLCKFLANIL